MSHSRRGQINSTSHFKKKNENLIAKNINKNIDGKFRNILFLLIDDEEIYMKNKSSHLGKSQNLKNKNFKEEAKKLNNEMEILDNKKIGEIEYTKVLINALKDAFDENDKVRDLKKFLYIICVSFNSIKSN
jgi:hypothetical protein